MVNICTHASRCDELCCRIHSTYVCVCVCYCASGDVPLPLGEKLSAVLIMIFFFFISTEYNCIIFDLAAFVGVNNEM